jgi:hypothetical protein
MQEVKATAAEARREMAGRTIWLWHYLHADWQWEQSRHWHEERYALAVQEALDIMQQNDEFCYYFDTTSEFFSAVAPRLGNRLEEVKEHIRNGRVRLVSGQVGNCRPTQVGDETYVRNMQLGREYFEQNLPPADLSLFHSVDIAIGGTQMPQLLNLAGFKYYRAWRPHGPMNALGIPHQFIWQGLDGSRILVTRGVYGGMWAAEDPPGRYKQDWDAAVAWLYETHFRDQLLQQRSPTQNLWYIQGYDDARPFTEWVGDRPMDLLGFIEEWRKREQVPIRWCTPLEYSQAVAAEADCLRVVEGVLDGADCSYNMANSGSHGLWMWRQMNDRRLLQAEKWAAAAASAGYVSPRDELKKLWYQHCVYQSHAEDFSFKEDWDYLVDLGRDVKFRAERIQQDAIHAIVQAAGGGTRTTRYILNPHSWPLEADVEVYHACAAAGVNSLQAVDENGAVLPQQQLTEFRHPRFGGSVNDERRLVRIKLPALGYRRISILENSETGTPRPEAPADGVVQTRDLKLVYRNNALREVYDKANHHLYSAREGGSWPGLFFHVLDNQNWLSGGPELRRERFVPTSGQWLQTGPLLWQHRSIGPLGPYAAQLDTLVADQGREIQVRVRLEGHWDQPPVTGHVTLMSDIEAGGQMTVDVPFGVEGRDPDNDVYVDNAPQGHEWGNVEMMERLRPGLFWARSWADWSGQGCGVSLMSADGCYYWLKEPNQFGHVVVRCMLFRKSSWEEFCPPSMTGSGVHEFSYALRLHDGDWRAADPQHRSAELRNPAVVARADCPAEATLPEGTHSFLQIDGPAILSAYYNEGNDAYVRFVETSGAGGQVSLTLDWPPAGAQAVDFLGQAVDTAVAVDGKVVSLTAKPWQIVTLKIAR